MALVISASRHLCEAKSCAKRGRCLRVNVDIPKQNYGHVAQIRSHTQHGCQQLFIASHRGSLAPSIGKAIN
eukprot:12122650-Karenia_brevis.AAC.1